MMTSSRFARLFWLGFAVAALALAAVWAYRVGSLPSIDEQRAVVPVSTVWGMHACVIAILAGLGGIGLPLVRILGRRRCLTALALAVTGYLACGLAPGTTRIFFDEHIYAQIGQTIAHTGRAEAANYARVEYGQFEMYSPVVNKQPNGLPYLLSWVYRIAGVSDHNSHFLNRALVGLAAAGLYLALALVPWTLPAGAGLASALLFIFTPLVMWWGHTVAVEPTAAATTVLAFFAACVHARLRDPETAQGLPASGLLLAGATAFAVYFRPESLLVFPMVAAVLWSTDDRFIEDISAWGALALATALAAPNLVHLWSVRTENWGASDGRRFALDFIGKNLQSNGGYFIDARWFPLAGTVLAVAGALWLLGRNRTAGLALGTWFAFSWGTFIVFYAGGYYYGASSRYGVVSCAPVAVFMGIGLAAVYGVLRRRPVFFYGLAAGGLVNWVAAMHYVPTLSREAVEAQADVNFIAEIAPTLPGGAIVLTPDPCIWMLQGINASQIFTLDSMVHNHMRELANQYPGGVYLHWSFWHNAEPNMARESAQLIVETKAVELARVQSHAHKDALFRLDTPAAMARFGGPPPALPERDTDLDRMLAHARAEAAANPGPAAK
ncbi:MAG: hypothetical protein DUW69_001109 [Verrucomicrobia bacterium]|jgi:Dolichyl-phosphate-mannose-protein mannosyltransferase|nr:MAG: hypothetical protein DUW69_001109 [Verrucomicrobiota bacterium]